MIRALKRYLQTRRAAKIGPRLKEVLAALGTAVPGLEGVEAVPSGHRGHDSTFYLQKKGKKVAVMRLNNPFISRPPPPKYMPYMLPAPGQRIARELAAYTQGAQLKLTPEPLWHAHDVLVCRYVPMKPLPEVPSWRLLRRVNAGISSLHSIGLTHMDMSASNILMDEAGEYFVFVDFEYAPAHGINVPTQRAYDYLRLLESCWKLMPNDAKNDYGPWLSEIGDRLGLDKKQVILEKLAPALERILAAPGLGDAIWKLFAR